jgi:FkbM family methyltransferase
MLLSSLGKKAANRVAALFAQGGEKSSVGLLTQSQEHALLSLPRYIPGSLTTSLGELYYVDACTLVVCAREIFDQQCYAFNGSGDLVILDCGANIGLSSIWLALRYPQASIEAFEADPNIYTTLARNLASLGLEGRVHAHNQALWTHNQGISFYCEGGASGRAVDKPSDTSPVASNQVVGSVTLPELLAKHPRIDLLKIDIEGAENHILADTAINLSGVKNLFLEYHSFHKEAQMLPEILARLKSNGFRVYIKEARVVTNPFTESEVIESMDSQLNVYAIRDSD